MTKVKFWLYCPANNDNRRCLLLNPLRGVTALPDTDVDDSDDGPVYHLVETSVKVAAKYFLSGKARVYEPE